MVKRSFTHQSIAISGLRIPVIIINCVFFQFPAFAWLFHFFIQGRIQESNEKRQGQLRLSMCMDKSSLTFSQSVMKCTCLCSCHYFYHMISSSHMSALPKFDFSCDFASTSHQHLMSVRSGNGYLVHDFLQISNPDQQPDWTCS